MLEKHIEALGELTARKQLEERAITEAAIEKAIESIAVDIDQTRKDIEAKFEAVEKAFSDAVFEGLGEISKDQTAQIEAVQDQVKTAIDETAGTISADVLKTREAFENALSEINDTFSTRLETLETETKTQHITQIQKLIDQLKAQEVFEGMLTARLAEIKDGKDGEKGEKGFQGERGEDGQDRPLLEPVELKADKDYPKNTLGTFGGGLWISKKETLGTPDDDPHSWACILDAMSDLSIELQEDKSYTLSVRMATGNNLETNFRIPFPEHKGIWEPGQYLKGQIVTKGSSFWLAQQDTDREPPGNGWQQVLTAPKGKQGPPGKSIEGPQGKPGRNGRDGKDAEIDWDIHKVFVEGLIYTDTRSASYPLRSFRGWYSEDESYLVGDVVRQDNLLLVVTDSIPIGTPYTRATAFTEVMFQGGPGVSLAADPIYYMLWKGEWSQQTYTEGHTVRDGDWTMVALRQTTDRAAPRAIGLPGYFYDGTMVPTPDTAKRILYGQRYINNPTAIFINGWRMDTIAGNNYSVYLVRDPLTNPRFTTITQFTATANERATANIGQILLRANEDFDLLVEIYEPDPTPTEFTGNWDYSNPNNSTIPGVGQVTQANTSPQSLRINAIDNDAADRTAELAALQDGDRILVNSINWVIVAVTDNGTWFDFTVSPAVVSATEGVALFTFQTYTATPITVGLDTDYWVSNPNIQGLYIADGLYENIVPNDNAYGIIEPQFQEAAISDDWDVVSPGTGGV